jgi:hypothetical protein
LAVFAVEANFVACWIVIVVGRCSSEAHDGSDAAMNSARVAGNTAILIDRFGVIIWFSPWWLVSQSRPSGFVLSSDPLYRSSEKRRFGYKQHCADGGIVGGLADEAQERIRAAKAGVRERDS